MEDNPHIKGRLEREILLVSMAAVRKKYEGIVFIKKKTFIYFRVKNSPLNDGVILYAFVGEEVIILNKYTYIKK